MEVAPLTYTCRAGYVTIQVVSGDITEFEGDAIVNPANTLMIMGGGVALAIKRRGGAEIEEEARRHAPVPIGEAVATGAGRLRVRYVIHAPTVERPGGPSSAENVYRAASAVARLVKELGLSRVALPLMGAGVGGLSPEESVESMLRALLSIDRPVTFYLYARDEETARRVEAVVRSKCG
ncbi:macro domain-containing protein [Thermogladius sp.]|uniref:macro domain-containing protein n=1 Tax=Thermogladius sp. TaxID=2023064 RepID=UPI003D0D3186